jgi:hypothetical protein
MSIKLLEVDITYRKRTLQADTDTNFILMEVHHRYDLEMKSCVNKEIIVFNSKLKS